MSDTSHEFRPKVAVSACLLGEPVRYDGSHKKSSFCVNDLAPLVDFVPVCPEVAIGMSIPRPPIHLVDLGDKDHSDIRAIGTKEADPYNPQIDVTQKLFDYGVEKGQQLSDLDGYIFMQKSPSCGIYSAKRYLPNGNSQGVISGLYAQGFQQQQPNLPLEEAGRLNDAGLRDNFLIRIYAHCQWRTLQHQGMTKSALIGFHSRHKYLLMPHSPEGYKALGQLLADLKGDSLEAITQQYISLFMQALSKPASRKRNANALNHVCGYLKRFLDSADRQDLAELVDRYRIGDVPIVVPFTLLQHHLNKHTEHESYVQQQTYLSPYPNQLKTRNLV